MVNFQRMRNMLMTRSLRGLYTGAGAVGSGAVGNFLADRLDSEVGIAVGQVAVGAAISVGEAGFEGGSEPLDPDGFIGEAIEFAGYGVQAAGYDELAEAMDFSFGQTGSHAGDTRVVDVSADAGSSQTGQEATQEEFLADVA